MRKEYSLRITSTREEGTEKKRSVVKKCNQATEKRRKQTRKKNQETARESQDVYVLSPAPQNNPRAQSTSQPIRLPHRPRNTPPLRGLCIHRMPAAPAPPAAKSFMQNGAAQVCEWSALHLRLTCVFHVLHEVRVRVVGDVVIGWVDVRVACV